MFMLEKIKKHEQEV